MVPRLRFLLVATAASVAITAAGCAIDDIADVSSEETALIDPIQACPIPDAATIAGHEGDFYRCVDELADDGSGCGANGYLLGYGARYAERFYQVTRPRMSARGRRWIDDVLVCLQQELQGAIDSATSCDDIRDLAFDSHPDCYVDAGFCRLPVLDLLQVVATIDVRDWLGSSAARQAAETAAACGREASMLVRLFFGHLLPR